MKRVVLLSALCTLYACGAKNPQDQTEAATSKSETPVKYEQKAKEVAVTSLEQVLAGLEEDHKQRFDARNPKETLEFFGIQPGMTVAEALPGGGWYSKILLPFLGKEGELIGVDYDLSMWPNFSFVSDEFLAKRKDWPQSWPAKAKEWGGELGAPVTAHTFSSLPASLDGSVDAVLFIRALHNLNRFQDKGEHLSNALQASFRVLKPGGIVGVVQHQAPEDKADDWANGSRGYLKKSNLISSFEKAGFVLVKESDINENSKDIPGEEDIVWRLPPSLSTSKEDEALKAEYQAIGESNRMTLVFKKPEAA